MMFYPFKIQSSRLFSLRCVNTLVLVFVLSAFPSTGISTLESPDAKPLEDFGNGVRYFGTRDTEHIRKILHAIVRKTGEEKKSSHWFLSSSDDESKDAVVEETLQKLVNIYNSAIKPLEESYHFSEISNLALGDGEFFAMPRVLFIGPWSTGKSSLINYMLGIENTSHALPSGAQPTTSDFMILSHGDSFKTVEGSVLVMDSKYSSLAKFGHKFLDRVVNVQIPSEILKQVNFIDTPGILENRKQQERGYPFSSVCQWFIDRSDLIILVFDPTKLDVGLELELLFRQLKQQEAKVHIVLNKVDSMTSEELLRVYGSLFWNLSPHINITEPPRVYVGSFWSKNFNPVSQVYHKVFLADEISLLHSIGALSCSRVQNKIAFLRYHALRVRNHALVVDQYVSVLSEQTSYFRKGNELASDIVQKPDKYKIFQKVLANRDVSKFDLYSASQYEEFFNIYSIDTFQPLSKHCGYVSSCLLDSVNYDIYHTLPFLIESFEAASEQVCLHAFDKTLPSYDSAPLHAYNSGSDE